MSEVRQDHEFEDIGILSGAAENPASWLPGKLQATRKFATAVRDNIPCTVTDDEMFAVADWVLNLMERYAAYHVEPVFTLDGDGPICSLCHARWPLCGHFEYASPHAEFRSRDD